MSGKPEGRGPPGLQNVLVYVSGDSFYQGNGNPNPGSYSAPSAVKQQQTPKQQFYNVQPPQNPVQNGYQYSVGYNNPGVRTVQRREDFTVMGGDGIGGNVVFPRCSESESSCGSVGASDQSDTSSGSGSVSVYKPSVSDSPASIAVPTGWKRLHTNGMVIYVR